MKAWLCENPTGVEALQWKELPTPAPAAGEILVAIKAASLNFPDLLIIQNKYQMKPPLPFVPGTEFAGVVEAVGEGVKGFKPGDAVAAFAGIAASPPMPAFRQPWPCRCRQDSLSRTQRPSSARMQPVTMP